MNKEYQFNLENLFYVIKKKIAWVVLIGILVAVLTFVLGSFLIVPKYSSRVSMYVNTAEGQQQYTQGDMVVAKSLVSTYIVVIESDSVLERVVEESGVVYSAEDVRNMIECASLNNTEAFTVTVTDPDPLVAENIARAIVKIAPDEIQRVVESGNVKIIDQPKVATEPDESGLKIFTAVAFVFGALVSFVVFFLVEVLDVTVYSEEDLTRQFTYPIIGTIPTILTPSETEAKNKKKIRKEETNG